MHFHTRRVDNLASLSFWAIHVLVDPMIHVIMEMFLEFVHIDEPTYGVE